MALCRNRLRVHGTRCTHLSKEYALSRSSTESSVDAGIPQAETLGTDECARGGSFHTFYRACTRAFERPQANSRESGSPNRASERRALTKTCSQPLQNRAGPGANVSFRRPRLSSMPVLLQHRLQFARHMVQLLSPEITFVICSKLKLRHRRRRYQRQEFVRGSVVCAP